VIVTLLFKIKEKENGDWGSLFSSVLLPDDDLTTSIGIFTSIVREHT